MTIAPHSSAEEIIDDTLAHLLDRYPPHETEPRAFLGAQFDAGLAWVHFDEGFGGLGLSRQHQPLIEARLRDAGAPNWAPRNSIGYGMAAPTILTNGSDEQRRRYLRPLFTCEEIWCQLFSEPGAGSDVASLSTRAIQDGEEWVLDGQKVWTSLALRADFGMALARTDPDVEKHRGLTYFVIDMHAPGVEVRPLRQMTGEADNFTEVFLTGLRVPDSERLSPVGEGWKAGLVTLMNERVSIGGKVPDRGSGPIETAVRLFKNRPPFPDDRVRRDRLMRLWVEAEVQRLTNLRAAVNSGLGVPGPEGSIGKLAMAEGRKRLYEFCVELLGADGMLFEPLGEHSIDDLSDAAMARYMFLRSRANSIEGGTSEVMRNILGERVLGLPADVRTDKGIPWSQVPRS